MKFRPRIQQLRRALSFISVDCFFPLSVLFIGLDHECRYNAPTSREPEIDGGGPPSPPKFSLPRMYSALANLPPPRLHLRQN